MLGRRLHRTHSSTRIAPSALQQTPCSTPAHALHHTSSSTALRALQHSSTPADAPAHSLWHPHTGTSTSTRTPALAPGNTHSDRSIEGSSCECASESTFPEEVRWCSAVTLLCENGRPAQQHASNVRTCVWLLTLFPVWCPVHLFSCTHQRDVRFPHD